MSGKTILLVEDNPADAFLFNELLSGCKEFASEHVSLLNDAREALLKKHYDVVLLDISLPDGNGLEALPQLYKQYPDVIFIMLTGLVEEKSVQKAMNLGADDYLVKGTFNKTRLIQAIKFSLERKKFRDREKKLYNQTEYLISLIPLPFVLLGNDFNFLASNSAFDTLLSECPSLKDRFSDWKSEINKAFDIEVENTLGKQLVLQVILRPAVWSDEDVTIVILHDLTSERTADLKFVNAINEKIEESDRIKTAFLSNLSHEYRTPLNMITGFSNLLLDSEGRLEHDKITEYLKVIVDNGHRLLSLFDNIVEYAKVSVGDIAFYRNVCNINVCMREILNKVHEKFNIEEGNFSIVKGLPDKEANIVVDEKRFKQIVCLLIGNAKKYARNGMIEFGYQKDQKELVFWVSDDGPGISPEKQDVIFDSFRQADDSLSRKHEGAGLGLALAKGLIELYGGKIWLESEVGKGSVFFFSIPYQTNNYS